MAATENESDHCDVPLKVFIVASKMAVEPSSKLHCSSKRRSLRGSVISLERGTFATGLDQITKVVEIR